MWWGWQIQTSTKEYYFNQYLYKGIWDKTWWCPAINPHNITELLRFCHLSSVACIYVTRGWSARGPRFNIGTRYKDICSSFCLLSSFSSFPHTNMQCIRVKHFSIIYLKCVESKHMFLISKHFECLIIFILRFGFCYFCLFVLFSVVYWLCIWGKIILVIILPQICSQCITLNKTKQTKTTKTKMKNKIKNNNNKKHPNCAPKLCTWQPCNHGLDTVHTTLGHHFNEWPILSKLLTLYCSTCWMKIKVAGVSSGVCEKINIGIFNLDSLHRWAVAVCK